MGNTSKTDPMLQKMVSPERRAEEIRLLKEYEASGKIKRVDYVPPAPDEEEEFPEKLNEEEVSDLGDGNKWRRPEE